MEQQADSHKEITIYAAVDKVNTAAQAFDVIRRNFTSTTKMRGNVTHYSFTDSGVKFTVSAEKV